MKKMQHFKPNKKSKNIIVKNIYMSQFYNSNQSVREMGAWVPLQVDEIVSKKVQVQLYRTKCLTK